MTAFRISGELAQRSASGQEEPFQMQTLSDREAPDPAVRETEFERRDSTFSDLRVGRSQCRPMPPKRPLIAFVTAFVTTFILV
jgi:hypothetical protein